MFRGYLRASFTIKASYHDYTPAIGGKRRHAHPTCSTCYAQSDLRRPHVFDRPDVQRGGGAVCCAKYAESASESAGGAAFFHGRSAGWCGGGFGDAYAQRSSGRKNTPLAARRPACFLPAAGCGHAAPGGLFPCKRDRKRAGMARNSPLPHRRKARNRRDRETDGASVRLVWQAPGEPTLYVAGDTVWCAEVEEAIGRFAPDVIVVFAGAARFLAGDPITMTGEDIALVAAAAPDSHLFVAHMETWNHCLLSRAELHKFLAKRKLQDRVRIPADGERIAYPAPGKA